MKDPIVEDVRATREAIAAKFKYNTHALAENARKHQEKSGHKIIKATRLMIRKRLNAVSCD